MSTVAVAWFRHLARNDAWANERLHAACARLSAHEYVATRTSFFPSIHRTLWHIALVDDYYLDALHGGGRGYRIFDDEVPGNLRGSHAEVRALQHALDRERLALVDALTDDDLARVVRIDRKTRFEDERVADVLAHLSLHGVHHRGQAHAMLSGTTVAPPQLDEYFLAADRPQAERELAAAGFGTARAAR